MKEHQPPVEKQLLDLNSKVKTAYAKGDFDEALRIARELESVALKLGLATDPFALSMIANQGEIFIQTKKYKDALVVFQKVAAGFAAAKGDNRRVSATIFERIGNVHFLKEDYEDAEKEFRHSLEILKEVGVTNTSFVSTLYSEIGHTFMRRRKHEDPMQNFDKAVTINDGLPPEGNNSPRADISDYVCSLYYFEFIRGYRKYMDFRGLAKRVEDYLKAHARTTAEVQNAGILNGKAISLPKPVVPEGFRSPAGFVLVDIQVNKDDNIEPAHARCGVTPYMLMSEQAAKTSKFSPTYVDGKPVKVTGTITYIFIGSPK